MELASSYIHYETPNSSQEVSEPLQPLEEYKVPETDAYPLPPPHSQQEPDGETIAEDQQADSSEVVLQPSVQGVLDLYQQGLTKEQIAQMLSIEEETVYHYLNIASLQLDITHSDMVVPKTSAYMFEFSGDHRKDTPNADSTNKESSQITLCNDKRTVEIDGQRVQLSFKEYALFEQLILNPQGILRNELASLLNLSTPNYLNVLKKRLQDRLYDFPHITQAIQSVGGHKALGFQAQPVSFTPETINITTVGNLQLNTITGELLNTGITLNNQEIRLLVYANENRDQTLTHELILDVMNDKVVDSVKAVNKLRNKLKKIKGANCNFSNVFGQGYIFEIQDLSLSEA